MPATLLIETGGNQQELECGPIVTIGRVAPNDIILSNDMKVSRNHALIRIMGDGRYYLIDMGSSNGTFVNENRVLMPHELKDADKILIGDSTVIFKSKAVTTDKQAGLDTSQVTVRASGTIRKITIMVADIRNFTGLNESVPADSLADILSKLFQAATQIVEKHGGVVDKFIGDAVMARWTEGKRTAADSVKRALSAVNEIERMINTLNDQYPDLPQYLQMGFGINSGDAVVGNIGVYGQRDHTAIGDAVNMAFRFESASKELQKDVVLGKPSYECLPQQMWKDKLQNIPVKGKTTPMPVWAITFAELNSLIKQ